MSDFTYLHKKLTLSRKKARSQNKSAVTLMSRIVITNSKITEYYRKR